MGELISVSVYEGEEISPLLREEFDRGFSMFAFDFVTIPQFCQHLNGVNTRRIQKFLGDISVIECLDNGWRASKRYEGEFFITRPHKTFYDQQVSKVCVSRKGAFLLYVAYRKGELPMRKDWDRQYLINRKGGW